MEMHLISMLEQLHALQIQSRGPADPFSSCSTSLFLKDEKSISKKMQLSSRKVEADTLEEGWKPRAAVTNSKETPLFICSAGDACWRLFPDKGKLLGVSYAIMEV